MSVLTSRYEPARKRGFAWGPHLALATALGLGAVVFVRASSHASADAALPLLSITLAATAAIACMAGMTFTRSPKTRRFTYWDVAGLLTFLAVCFAAMVEPDQMVRLVRGAEAN
jgi:hypothetical protein